MGGNGLNCPPGVSINLDDGDHGEGVGDWRKALSDVGNLEPSETFVRPCYDLGDDGMFPYKRVNCG